MFCKCLLVEFPPTVRALSTHTSIFFDLKVVTTLINWSVLFIGLGIIRLIILRSLWRLSRSLKPIIHRLWGVYWRASWCSFFLLFIFWIRLRIKWPWICLLSCVSLHSRICLLSGICLRFWNRRSLWARYLGRSLIRIIELRFKSFSIITWSLSWRTRRAGFTTGITAIICTHGLFLLKKLKRSSC